MAETADDRADRAIFYICSAMSKPRGGIKQIYRHVDILCRHGYPAAVVHPISGFRVTWFENTTPVIDRAQFRAAFRPDHDVVVIPEGIALEAMLVSPHRVIFNQNAYYGFVALGPDVPDPDPYRNIAAALVVSDHNAELLRFAYPGLDVVRVRCGVDAEVFRPRPLRDKKRQVVCVARKGEPVNLAVFHALASRRRARGLPELPWCFLEDRPQAAVAQILAESLIVLFASVEEGFGLLPVEAMLAGCLVITHGSGPQREYAPARSCYAEHDIPGIVRAIEEIVEATPEALEARQALCDEARTEVATAYSLAAEEASVLAAWERVLSATRRRPALPR